MTTVILIGQVVLILEYLFLILFLGSYSIARKSKKQPTITLSSVEADYMALRLLVAEVSWVLKLLAELGVADLVTIDIFCDIQSAIHIAKNSIFHKRSKHMK